MTQQYPHLIKKQISKNKKSMFSSNIVESNQNKVKSYLGVDLSNYNCHKLESNPLYSNYEKDEWHYVIDAVQKGLKPHTKLGLKRLKRKNDAKMVKNTLSKNTAPQTLEPKSPEAICMKALRSEFRQTLYLKQTADGQIDTRYHSMAKKRVSNRLTRVGKFPTRVPTIQAKSPKIIKRKEHQRARRHQLIGLVKKYRNYLLQHFNERLIGYGRCPKVSRQQIKDYLLTLGIVAKLDPIVDKPKRKQYLLTNQIPLNVEHLNFLQSNMNLNERGINSMNFLGMYQPLNLPMYYNAMPIPNLIGVNPMKNPTVTLPLKEQDFPSLLTPNTNAMTEEKQ